MGKWSNKGAQLFGRHHRPWNCGGKKSIGYFRSTEEWHVKSHITPRDKKAPRTRYDNQTMIDLTIKCTRPWSVLSTSTTISIEVHFALRNDVFLDRWKAEFAKSGLSCDILEEER
jgi:hypothetical protein